MVLLTVAVALPPPLAAADWLELVLPVLFVIFWLVSQIVNLVQRVRGAGGGAAAPQRPPVAVPGKPRPPVAQPPARERLELEIEAFRRAQAEAAAKGNPAARPAQPRQTGAPGGPVRQAPPVAQGQKPTPASPARPAPAQPAKRVSAARPAPAEPARPAAGSVARHVEEAFSHDLAHSAGGIHPTLGAQRTSAAGAATAGDAAERSTAAAIVAMIRSPATVRQAILLREVLDRPVHRW